MNNKKVQTNKSCIAILLDDEIRNDPRFGFIKNWSLASKLKHINKLRLENKSHLTNRQYALWIAYNQGLSAFKKYSVTFAEQMKSQMLTFKKYIDTRKALIEEFIDIKSEVEYLTSDIEK